MTGLFGGRDIVVVDLGFGDAGKGATVDWLCSPAAGLDVAAVVRFNGGAQAAHNVVARGRHHTFSQFGSGTLDGVPTVLSRHVLVEPIALATEARALAALGVPDPLSLLHIDARALLTTPVHVVANRAREDARGAARHGSCGKGIGETASYALEHPDAPTVGACRDPKALRRSLIELVESYRPMLGTRPVPDVDEMVGLYTEFAAAVRISDDGDLTDLAARGRLVFEGAQGVLLDEWRGFHPHTTWSTVEPSGAHRLLAELGRDGAVLGVTRTYTTRHGAGPHPTEDPALAAALPDPHNGTGRYQGRFRVGHLDEVLLRYAVEVCGRLDGLAVTHLDAPARAATAGTPIRVCHRYRGIDRLPVGRRRDLDHQQLLTGLLHTAEPEWARLPADVPARMEDVTGVPVVLTSGGPDRADRHRTAPVAA